MGLFISCPKDLNIKNEILIEIFIQMDSFLIYLKLIIPQIQTIQKMNMILDSKAIVPVNIISKTEMVK